MRSTRATASIALATAALATSLHGQSRSNGSDASNKVAVRVFVSLSDSTTRYFPVVGHRLAFYRTARDSIVIVTDSIGSARASLTPGEYRLVSSRPVGWRGYDYSWNVPINVRAGMPVIDLRPPDAVTTAAAEPLRGLAEARQQGNTTPTSNAPLVGISTSRPVVPQNRHGIWFNIGMGSGSLGCSTCDGRVTGLSGGLGIGGTINQHVSLGVFTNGWYKSEEGVTLNAGVLTVGMRLYPSEESGFFLVGGLGIATVELSANGYGNASASGSGALLGLGWDLRLSDGLSLTPFWNGIGIANSTGDANYGQIGIGLTIR